MSIYKWYFLGWLVEYYINLEVNKNVWGLIESINFICGN